MTRSDNMIIPEILEAEQLRKSCEVIDLFNGASGGCIVLENQPARRAASGGDYKEKVRLKRPANLVSHVDTTSPSSTAATVTLGQTKGSSVVWQGKIGPLTYTRDEVVSGALTPEEYSMAVARLFAEEKLIKIRNNAIAAAVAAIESADTTDGTTSSPNIHVLDAARGKTAGGKVTCSMAYINRILTMLGDARESIECFVIPSMVYADLVGDSISNYKLDTVAGTTFAKDVIQAFNRRVIVADIPALVSDLSSGYYTEYAVLGLGKGAIQATIVQEDPVETEKVITTEVTKQIVRQDFDVDIEIEGMKWSPSSATPNPTDAQLATAANWAGNYDDHRQVPIAKGIFNGAGGV